MKNGSQIAERGLRSEGAAGSGFRSLRSPILNRSWLRVAALCAAVCLPAAAEQTTVTVLATTDLHGTIYPVDYFTGRPADRGLAKIATLIRAARAENPNALLIDCGDTIQGSPLESVWQHYIAQGRLPLGLEWDRRNRLSYDPMMLVMNHLGYRAMTLGNHEFNFGLENLNRARADARFPWLSANTQGGAKPFAAYIVENLGDVKVAVIGLTTPVVPRWEQPRNYSGYRFLPMAQAAAAAVADLRRKEQPDIIVAAIHSGLGRDAGDDREENSVYEVVSTVPGIDAVFFGHTHGQVAGEDIGGVLAVQPKNWGMSLGRIDFTLEREDGRWRVVKKTSRLIPVTAATAADSEVLALARPYHEITERYLSTPVAEAATDLDGRDGRIRDTALVDAIHAVQMHYAKADVSFTALFNPRVHVAKGPVTVRDVAALYVYDNELYAIDGTGRMVKDALENAARYFLSCPDEACSHGPLIDHKVLGYNFDMAEGVEYDIDLRRPAGDRIVNLRRNGRPLPMDEKLRIAVNNYRYGGSSGYSMFRGARILWKSSQDIRTLIIDYFTERRRLPERADGNWKIVPAGALRVLETEVTAADERR